MNAKSARLLHLIKSARLFLALKKNTGLRKEPHELAEAHHTDFHSALAEAQKKDPRISASVHLYSPDEYKGMRTFLAADKQSGYAIKHPDEVVSVFSVPRGRGTQLMQHAIGNGASSLDCFDGPLPGIYRQHGFEETKRESNWEPGGPDVVYMRRK